MGYIIIFLILKRNTQMHIINYVLNIIHYAAILLKYVQYSLLYFE